MKKNRTIFPSLLILLTCTMTTKAQDEGRSASAEEFCSTHEAMEEYYQANPQAQKEHDALKAFTQQYMLDHYNDQRATATYRIPVVFHVYGGASHTFSGLTVTKAIIDGALADLNKDFNGLNDDFNLVNQNFLGIRGTLNISFELALKKPDGSPTDGVDWKTTTGTGYALSSYDTQVAADAWDCKKYMNVYIVSQTKTDGSTTHTGTTYFPSTSMTNANTARCVYNGRYLGANTDKETASTLTHEFGHWLNLDHTYGDYSCTGIGDGINDTPSHTSTSLGCHPSATSSLPKSDCGNWTVNVENYMDYNGAWYCYRMFTQGQVTWMTAALNANDITRFPLWQTNNLITTGLLSATGINQYADNTFLNIYPNPNNGNFAISFDATEKANYKLELKNTLGQLIFQEALTDFIGSYTKQINLQKFGKGVYLLNFITSNNQFIKKIMVY
jgi:hypothetical protein